MAGADVEALSRSFRSRVLLLGLLLAGGLAAAIWSSTRDAGIGEPEDRRRLMVVTGESEINYFAVLDRAGFLVEVDDYDDWLSEARTALPESEAEGVGLVLELADLRGFGLVVFERPSERDFSGLELEPALDSIDRLDERDYAALSVGDFAFPHRLTVDEPGEDPLVRLPGYGALEAVFRQELIRAREDADRPTVEELQFEDAVAVGRQMVERPAEFPGSIAAARASVEAGLDDGSGAKTLVAPLTTGTAIPTPDGGVLVFHHDLVIYSDNARTLELEADAQMRISWVGPEAVAAGLETGEFESTACTSLAGGVLSLAEPPRIAAARDGSVVGIGSAEDGTVVWRKTGPGCEWDAVAELETSGKVVLAPAPTDASMAHGIAAHAVKTEFGARLSSWAMSGSSEAGEGQLIGPSVLLEQVDRDLEGATFIDDRFLAVTSARVVDGGDARVLVLDHARPGVYLSVPAEFFATHRILKDIVTIAPATADSGPELLIFARRDRAELIRLRIAGEAWAEFLAAEPAAPEPGVEGRMVSLIPEQLDAEQLADAGQIWGADVAAGQVIFAYTDFPNPSELALFDLETRERRRLTDNDVRDYIPRFGPDARFATFVSLMQVNISIESFSVPRALKLRE